MRVFCTEYLGTSMDEQGAELFNDSLERCLSREGFLARFYERLVESNEEVAEKFVDTDFRRQTRMLRMSLYLLMLAASDVPEATAHLERLAGRHSRSQLDIRPELYEYWMDCLVATVEEFDPCCDEETKRAWRSVMAPGIDYMKAHY